MCKAQNSTTLTKLASRLVSSRQFCTRAVSHGRQYEAVAVERFELDNGLITEKCGLFLSKMMPYLAASPDRVVDEDSILEIKCPYSSRNQMISPVTVPYLIQCGDDMTLDRNHNYYYQVQGQLFCAERRMCYFCVYTLCDCYVAIIHRDDEFIAHMLNTLQHFYANYFRNAVLDKIMYRQYSQYF